MNYTKLAVGGAQPFIGVERLANHAEPVDHIVRGTRNTRPSPAAMAVNEA